MVTAPTPGLPEPQQWASRWANLADGALPALPTPLCPSVTKVMLGIGLQEWKASA